MAVTPTSRSFAVPAADLATAERHFRARLALETDPSDVHAELSSGVPGLVVVDVRSAEAFAQGHLPGAVHCPHAEVLERGRDLVPDEATAVVYCWGPGCNGATRGALAFARLGIRVKEMIGGFEWWAREGLQVETAADPTCHRRAAHQGSWTMDDQQWRVVDHGCHPGRSSGSGAEHDVVTCRGRRTPARCGPGP